MQIKLFSLISVWIDETEETGSEVAVWKSGQKK